MRLNENICIVGKSVMLMPYKAEYVPKYHEWMKSEELQKLTASEPLSLEEEYEMQKTWRNDEDKLTFIILDKTLMKNGEIEALIGDTNIFLSHDQDTGELVGEIEIMIAEETARGKGLGWESTLIMLKYGVDHLKIKSYLAKIGLDNEKSIQMFGRMGFQEESRSTVFNEITLVRACDSTLIRMLERELPGGQMDIQDLPLLTE